MSEQWVLHGLSTKSDVRKTNPKTSFCNYSEAWVSGPVVVTTLVSPGESADFCPVFPFKHQHESNFVFHARRRRREGARRQWEVIPRAQREVTTEDSTGVAGVLMPSLVNGFL